MQPEVCTVVYKLSAVEKFRVSLKDILKSERCGSSARWKLEGEFVLFHN